MVEKKSYNVRVQYAIISKEELKTVFKKEYQD